MSFRFHNTHGTLRLRDFCWVHSSLGIFSPRSLGATCLVALVGVSSLEEEFWVQQSSPSSLLWLLSLVLIGCLLYGYWKVLEKWVHEFSQFIFMKYHWSCLDKYAFCVIRVWRSLPWWLCGPAGLLNWKELAWWLSQELEEILVLSFLFLSPAIYATVWAGLQSSISVVIC